MVEFEPRIASPYFCFHTEFHSPRNSVWKRKFHPCLHLFQSQTNEKHKIRTTAWSFTAIFYLRITSLFEGTEIAHVNMKRVKTGSDKPGQLDM